MDSLSSPQLSVIMPVWNCVDRLETSVGSVLAEKDLNLELICIDDGSTDGSGEKLAALAAADPRLRVISRENGGQAAARNSGLAELRGDFVTFVDADDRIEPGYLRELLQAIEAHGADLVVTRLTRSLPGCEPVRKPLVADVRCAEVDAATLLNLTPNTCGRLYRREVLERAEARFPMGVSYGEDSCFNLIADAHCRRVVLHPSTGYIYEDNDKSVSKLRIAEKVTGMVEALAALAASYRAHGMSPMMRELLVGFASHALKRIRSMARHATQRDCARRAAEILRSAGVSDRDLGCLKPKERKRMRSIMAGGSGLGFGYYWRRFHHLLRGK